MVVVMTLVPGAVFGRGKTLLWRGKTSTERLQPDVGSDEAAADRDMVGVCCR